MRHHCPSPAHRPDARHRCLLAGLALLFGVAWPAAAAAALDGPFGDGMPLVLKDGRIANVTVHSIPFETGAADLDDATAETLRTTFEPLATDCFLTAQAIGHVAPGITRDGDTLSAHRLARARADTIQAALAGFGMPHPSVASVWDWQFLLEKSEVTLWVFSLTEGDDCNGTPLPKGEPLLATADGETGATTTAPSTDGPLAAAPSNDAAPTESPADAEPPVSAVVAAPASPAPPVSPAPSDAAPPASASVATAPRELRVAGTAVEPDARDDSAVPGDTIAAEASEIMPQDPLPQDPLPRDPQARDPLPRDPLATAAVAPAEAGTSGAAAEPAEPSTEVAAIDPDTARVAGAAGAPALAITFEMNSSYFPSGVGRELRAFLDSLPSEGPIEIELSGAVGSSAVRGASGEEAQRYNAWMAERRIERVAEWLEKNAAGRQLTFAEQLVENDPSRQVRLRASVVQ